MRKTEYTKIVNPVYKETEFKTVNANEVPYVSVGKGPVEIHDTKRQVEIHDTKRQVEIHEPREEREYLKKDEENIHVKFNINKT